MNVQIQIIGWGEAPDEPLVSTSFGSRGRPARQFSFNRLAKAIQRAVPAFFALLLLALPAAVQAQFNYTTNNGTITITGYIGPGGDVAIPDNINGLPVTGIGDYAFYVTALTKVMIPNSVTSIGDYAFYYCTSLANVTIGGSVFSIGQDAFADCYSLTSVTIPDSVTSIGFEGFADCISLVSITIPAGVSYIGEYAFADCDSLSNVYFKGDAPVPDGTWFIIGDVVERATAYYLPGTTGWADFSATTGVRAVPWQPLIQTGDAGFGVRTNQFGFNISWASGRIVVVEASTNLSDWTPIATKTLTGDTFYFNDLEWANYSSRFYQLLDFLTPPPGSGGYTGFDFYLDICRSPNSDFNSKIEAFHMIVTFVISNEIRDPISLGWASEAAYIAFSLDPNDPDLNILTAYIGGVRGP